jgi:hypothetical protein
VYSFSIAYHLKYNLFFKYLQYTIHSVTHTLFLVKDRNWMTVFFAESC